MKRLVILLLVLIVWNENHAQDALPTTLILVRHAEKGFDEGGDPDLTEAGFERASLLAQLLKAQPVDAIYTTPFKRTRQTVDSLAALKKVPIEEYNPFKLDDLMTIIKASDGKTLVFSGHSNTIPVMLNKLTNSDNYKMLDEDEYDNLYIVTLSTTNEPVVVNLKYGE